jgi:hypothetical protein
MPAAVQCWQDGRCIVTTTAAAAASSSSPVMLHVSIIYLCMHALQMYACGLDG